MSFPRYPKYKDSGVEWLGEVPEGWRVARLGFLAGKIGSGKTPAGGAEVYQDQGVLFLRSQNVHDIGLELSDVAYIAPEVDEEMAGSRVEPGDLLLNITGASLGRSCIVPDDFPGANVNQHVCIIRPSDRRNGQFLAWAMKSQGAKANMDHSQNGAAREGLNYSQVSKLHMVLPPKEEQTSIASFLDRETARIDALVAEQERLIELLREKRQAVISHAVTKGLDPTVPMKDSGVEWLGEVPAHWGVASLRRVVDRIEQGWSPECHALPADDGDWGVLKSGCVNRGTYNEMENKALPANLTAVPMYEVRAGDVLMSRASGSPELVGSTAFVYATRPRLMLSDKVFRPHLRDTMLPRFFVWTLNSQPLRAQIERAISGAEGLANNLPQSALLRFSVVVPRVDEQAHIIAHLDTETTRLDALVTEAQRAIALLQERRTALITAAVTGQIDIRNHETPEQTHVGG